MRDLPWAEKFAESERCPNLDCSPKDNAEEACVILKDALDFLRAHLDRTIKEKDKLLRDNMRMSSRIPKEDGCTCGNLVYEPGIVGNTGHMMDCPVYRIRMLEDRIAELESGKGGDV